MLGPSWWMRTSMPEPWHLGHLLWAPSRTPQPVPRGTGGQTVGQGVLGRPPAPAAPHSPPHLRQMMFFCRDSFRVEPLYRSSSDTESWCTTVFPGHGGELGSVPGSAPATCHPPCHGWTGTGHHSGPPAPPRASSAPSSRTAAGTGTGTVSLQAGHLQARILPAALGRCRVPSVGRAQLPPQGSQPPSSCSSWSCWDASLGLVIALLLTRAISARSAWRVTRPEPPCPCDPG